MPRKFSLLLCLLFLASPAVFADIDFSGSGPSGTIAPGQAFIYNFDLNPDWGVPGVGNGLAIWSGATVDGFTISFTGLPQGVGITNLGTSCDGGFSSGTVFCASPYSQPWVATLSNNDTSVTFMAQSGGDLLTNGDPFFINIDFTSDPNGAAFSGSWIAEPVPEPGSIVLFGSGALALVGVFRRKMRL